MAAAAAAANTEAVGFWQAASSNNKLDYKN